MSRILEELEKTTFYIATCEGDQPRVRPFGAIAEIDGHLCTCTNNTKDVYKQIMANPKVEISSMPEGGKWLRITAEAYRVDDDSYRRAFLEAMPSLGRMYHMGDGIFEVIRLDVKRAVKCSFTAPPEDLMD
ncbi:MAG: pyridoxamine 5'-phosphate oxidase family protein [Solobacterium sp.]|nr:pyridoxamine 5'-phosphate oxidase family protein [Solobacterium sp.]